MGRGIAQLLASHGYSTLLYDLDQQSISIASKSISENLQQLVLRNKISAAEQASTLAHLRYTTDLNDCIADLVIEAIIERLPEKIALLNQLAELNHSETIFATNTSSLSVSAIADKVQHPDRVAGMHFFNPPVLMKLVEMVHTDRTNPQVIETLEALCTTLGKTVVHCNDAPGFIVNRVARPYYLEALHIAQMQLFKQSPEISSANQQKADPQQAEQHRAHHHDPQHQAAQRAVIETIDRLMEASGFRMGPFRLMDLIGNDINFAVSTSLYEALNKPARLAPSAWQQQKVADHELGKKTGKGFYVYDEPATTKD